MTAMTSYARSQRPRQAILGQLPRIHRADGTPIRVLLVDDEPALTNLVKMALHYEGWDVEIAHNGREAIAKFEKIGPDVLVLDIMLPDVDGLQILQRVRESDAYTPTLFLTARDSVMDRVTGLTAGADDYMTKPFSLEELVARLRGLLRRSSHMPAPSDESLKVGDLRLDAASTAPDTAFIAVLQDIDENRKETPVTAGYLRAGLRKVDEAASTPGMPVLPCRTFEAVPIGETVRYRIPLVPNAEPAPSVSPLRDKLLDAKVRLHRRLIEEINLSAIEKVSEGEVRRQISALVSQYVLAERIALNAQELEDFVDEIIDEMTGLGPIEPLLKDPSVNDILINGHECVYVERAGMLEPTPVRFKDEAHLLRIVNKIVSAVGRRVDESQPLCDARLLDGSRINGLVCNAIELRLERSAADGREERHFIAFGNCGLGVGIFLVHGCQ